VKCLCACARVYVGGKGGRKMKIYGNSRPVRIILFNSSSSNLCDTHCLVAAAGEEEGIGGTEAEVMYVA